ncbi:RNA polymerase III Rpc [Parasponia andersonii]|uniref:DNA-directed RNA polymerase III subunit RPC3 n=1 Tax=Parasponia andersonii TaxID=3476 RepID=A0A2P5BSF1_PARAD|nr:RNA polymerase III Rpc [Parasponia andersonii]
MVTQYGIKFAVHLITSHFGNLVSKVCDNLLRRGPLTLQLLIRFTELTPLQVKNSLLILIQHNCVQAFSTEHIGAGGNEVKVTQYLALFDNILHRLRFPKFLAIVSQELDKDCEEIFEGLIQHGRLTLEQISDRAESSAKTGGKPSSGGPAVRDAVREGFHKLLNSRFVERCPAPEPFLEPPSEPKSSNKRGAKSKLAGASETEEQRILASAAPIEALRFSLLTTSGTDLDAEKDGTGSSVGEKRKHAAVDSDEEFGSKDKEVVLWRVNFEEFIRCLRHKACMENVRARLDDGAAIVLKAVLDATRSAEQKVKTETSVPLLMNTIFEEVMKNEAGRSLTLDRVRASLIQLGCPSAMRGTDETYSIDLKKIIELAQNEEVESIVLKRYGRDAYRMFRLLSKAGQLLETDKIADMTFVEKKETPNILYKLWQDEYLHMEKLVVSSARQFSFMLWKVNKPILWEHVLDEMYHAALNLNQRLIYEQEQKELYAIQQGTPTGSTEKDRLRNAKIYLHSSLVKLDDALMLFHDF